MSEEEVINYLKDITENKNFKICFFSDDMAKTILNLIERQKLKIDQQKRLLDIQEREISKQLGTIDNQKKEIVKLKEENLDLRESY